MTAPQAGKDRDEAIDEAARAVVREYAQDAFPSHGVLQHNIAALVRRAVEQAVAKERGGCVGVLQSRIDKCAAEYGTSDDPGELGCDICDQLRKDIAAIRARSKEGA